jgi:uncharacterized protein (UPF0332 family)
VNQDDTATLIRYRISEARAALKDADCLAQGGGSSQGIVNRLYYAMFYAALALLQQVGKVPSKHAGVLGLFDTEFVLKGIFSQDMSKHFHRAFELRQTSDYKVMKPIPPEQLEEIRQQASAFVSAVARYLEVP